MMLSCCNNMRARTHVCVSHFPYIHETCKCDSILGQPHPVAYPEILFGGVQQIQFRTEDRENGDLGAVAPRSGVLEAAVI